MIEVMTLVVWLGMTTVLPIALGVFVVTEAVEIISNVKRKKNK